MSCHASCNDCESSRQTSALPFAASRTPRVREGERCFHELAHALPDPVRVVRADGRLAYTNPACDALTALPIGAEFASSYAALVHPEDRQRWVDTWQNAQRTHGAYEAERRLLFIEQGAYVRQVERAHPVCDATGEVIEWVLTAATPANETQQLVERLRRSLVSKDEALMAVAHEMRNPLAPIASAVKLLERQDADPECVAHVRAMIERQVRQLARLVEDLLDLGRLEQRQLAIRKERTDLRGALAAAVQTAQPIVAARHHQLATTVPSDAAEIVGDEGRLTQVIVNLLVNAAKFTETGGRISLRLEREGAALVIRVRDNGIGIARDMLPQIFDPYVRVAHAGAGLGLGLALAREIVQLYGGTLVADSEGFGKGSEFVLKLPSADPQAAADA